MSDSEDTDSTVRPTLSQRRAPAEDPGYESVQRPLHLWEGVKTGHWASIQLRAVLHTGTPKNAKLWQEAQVRSSDSGLNWISRQQQLDWSGLASVSAPVEQECAAPDEDEGDEYFRHPQKKMLTIFVDPNSTAEQAVTRNTAALFRRLRRSGEERLELAVREYGQDIVVGTEAEEAKADADDVGQTIATSKEESGAYEKRMTVESGPSSARDWELHAVPDQPSDEHQQQRTAGKGQEYSFPNVSSSHAEDKGKGNETTLRKRRSRADIQQMLRSPSDKDESYDEELRKLRDFISRHPSADKRAQDPSPSGVLDAQTDLPMRQIDSELNIASTVPMDERPVQEGPMQEAAGGGILATGSETAQGELLSQDRQSAETTPGRVATTDPTAAQTEQSELGDAGTSSAA